MLLTRGTRLGPYEIESLIGAGGMGEVGPDYLVLEFLHGEPLGGSVTRDLTAGSAGASASIAVLPFANMSTDADDEYFSDGLAEEVINALTQVPGLKVIARTSAFAFKGKNEDIRP